MNLSTHVPRNRPALIRLALCAILLVAFALRLWGLDQHNIWWDEGFTVWITRLPVLRMLDRTAHDVHPPLSYLMQRGWWLLTGEGEWPMRFLAALGGTTAVAVAYAFARRLGGPVAGLLAALFLALSVFAVVWSQEIRMYAWVSVWGLLALYAALRFWQTPRLAWFSLYALATAAGLLSLYLFVAVPLVVNLAFLFFWWRAGRGFRTLARWILAQVAVVALVAPWLAYALPRMPSWSSTEPYSAVFFLRLYATVLATGIGENIEAWAAPAALVLLVFAACAVTLVRLPKRAGKAGGLALLLLAVLLPPAMVFAVTAFPGRQFHVPRLAPRYFLPLSAAFYVLLGWGIAEISRLRKPLALAGAGVIGAVALTTLAYALPPRVATDQYVSLAQTIRAHERAGDKILLYPDEDWPLFAAQYAGAWEKAPTGTELTEENVPWLLTPIWESSEGLWVVTTSKARETDPDALVPAWLEARAERRREWDFGETRLTLYARTAERSATLDALAPGHTPKVAASGAAGGGEFLAPRLPLRRYRIGETLNAPLYWLSAPAASLTLGLREAETREELMPPSLPTEGPARVVGRLLLTPDLQPGNYHVVLREGGREVAELGRVELVASRAGPARGAEPQHRLDLRLGQSIRLLGYDLPEQVVRPGEFARLTLYWQGERVLTDRYKVFTHLIGEVWNAEQGSFLWGQQDNEPQADQLPTTRWAPGDVIVDSYRIKVDPKAPPGRYRVEAGMYGYMDGARLTVTDGQGQPHPDSVTLGEVEVR